MGGRHKKRRKLREERKAKQESMLQWYDAVIARLEELQAKLKSGEIVVEDGMFREVKNE